MAQEIDVLKKQCADLTEEIGRMKFFYEGQIADKTKEFDSIRLDIEQKSKHRVNDIESQTRNY